MDAVTITKISVDGNNYYNISGTLDLNERVFSFSVPYDNFENIFKYNPAELYNDYNKIRTYTTYYLSDDMGKLYTLFNCIFGFKLENPINFHSLPIELIFSNVSDSNRNILVDSVIFKTSFPRKFLQYITDIDFKYDYDKKVSIKRIIDGEKLILEYRIKCLHKRKYKILSNIIYSMLELTFLYVGDFPKIEDVYCNDDIHIYFENVPKYNQRKDIYYSSTNGIINYVEKNIFSTLELKKFIKFRNNSGILFDMLLININNSSYIEISNSMMIQLIDGFYKTFTNKLNHQMWQILQFYFIKNSTINSILVKRDLKPSNDNFQTPIFLLKARNHRNYLSHLNMNGSDTIFYSLENNYAFWKLSLTVRIIILQLLNITININEFNKTKESIECWALKHHLKLKQ